MERVHFDENENRRDCIGGKIKKEDHEMDKIRNNCHQSIIISLVEAAGYPMLKTKIRYSRKVSESTYARKPIPLYSTRSLAAKDYECLVKEYLVAAGAMMDKWTEGREA